MLYRRLRGSLATLLALASLLAPLPGDGAFTIWSAPRVHAQFFDVELSCSATDVEPNADVTCNAVVPQEAVGYERTWVPEGLPSGETGQLYKFSEAGGHLVTVEVCLLNRALNPEGTEVCELRSITVTVRQATVTQPRVSGLSCGDTIVRQNQSVSCTASVDGPTTRQTWSAPSASNTSGTGLSFSTTFPSPSNQPLAPGFEQTIKFEACNTPAGGGDELCDSTTVLFEVTGTTGPQISSLGCEPGIVQTGAAVSCTPVVSGPELSYSWTATPGGAPGAGSAPRFETTFNSVGRRTITLKICAGFGPPTGSCEESSQIVEVTGSERPNIRSLGCGTGLVAINTSVSCNPDVSGSDLQFTWTATGGVPGGGSSRSFSTSFSGAGDKTISLRICSGNSSECDTANQAITVAGPRTPEITSLGCPTPAEIQKPVTCVPTINGTAPSASYSWTATNATTPSGSGPAFTTTFTVAGTREVTLQVCNGTACSTTARQAITVTGPTAVAVSLRGTIRVTEQNIDCEFSAMPDTRGDITMTLTPGANSLNDPWIVTGELSGSGSNSRSISCSGGTAFQTWTSSYRTTFTGTADPRTGAVVLNGRVALSPAANYDRCRNTSGGDAPCPNQPRPSNVAMTLGGSLNFSNATFTTGDGSINMATGCTTVGSWTIR